MSSPISFRQHGDFSKLTTYLEKLKSIVHVSTLDKYGRLGVQSLKEATPKDTGLTAASWYYKIERSNDAAVLAFYNSNINEGTPIAVILQYGHGTGTGGWVAGNDYINPALRDIFDQLADEVWKETKS